MSQGMFARAARAVVAAAAIGIATVAGAGAASAAPVNVVTAVDGTVTSETWTADATQLNITHTFDSAAECNIDYTLVTAAGTTEAMNNQALGNGGIGGTYSIKSNTGGPIASVTYTITCLDWATDPSGGTVVTVAGPKTVTPPTAPAPGPTSTTVTAADPTFVQGTCDTTTGFAGTFTLPVVTGVNYLVDGVVKTGTVNVTGGVHTVTVQAQAGYTLTNPDLSVSHDFGACSVAPQGTPVTAEAPQYLEQCTATSIAEIYIPAITGVTYYINDKPVSGTIPVVEPGEIVVTAAANTGYVLTNDVAVWSHTFPACTGTSTATTKPTIKTATTTTTNGDTPTVIETDVPAQPADHTGLLAGGFAGLTGVAAAAFFLARRNDED